MSTDQIRALCAELAQELAEEYGVQREFNAGDPLLGSGAIELLSRARAALAQPEPQGPSDEALAAFTEWFCRNYPGPDTIIHKPTWHAPRAFRAAVDALTRYATPQPSPVPAPMSADTLAAIIREVDGTHRLGAAALAEAILAHPAAINALPVPGAEGPISESELAAMWNQQADAFNQWESLDSGEQLAWAQARAIARYARPTIEPVPVSERLPGPEDCDAEGRCWWFRGDSPILNAYWDLSKGDSADPVPPTAWLPHHALPIPTP